MKKHTLLLMVLAFYLNVKAQIPTINHDYWQAVNTYSVNNTPYQDFNKSVVVEDKLMMIIDTFSGNNPYTRKGIFEYNTTTRNTSPLAYPIQDGDRGIQSVTAYKTSTPGLTYGVFGCYSGSDVGDNYPVFYTYNSLTSTFSSDSINIGASSDFEGGISNIAMFSPTTNHDTIRFFAKMNTGTQVFKKHINQTSVMPTYSTIDMEYVNHSFVFNNVLYVAGDSSVSNYQLLEKSVDGITFTQPNNIKFFSFPIDSKIALLDTLNGKLLIGVNMVGNSGHQFYSYDGNVLQFLFGGSSGIITSGKHFKNRFWFSTSYYDSGSTANYAFIYFIPNSIPFNIITDTSVEAFGGDAIDGNYMNLAATQDSLYFVGNKGTFQPSIILNDNNNAEQRHLALNDRYLEVYKLMPPVSSFNYNNNQICLNTTATFTSTSQNADSLRWIKDGNYSYASSPGGTATMNYYFNTVGSHTVGLIANGGTMKDTMLLTVNVYSITVAVSGQSVICIGNSFVMTSTVTGAMGTPTYSWKDYVTSPTTDLSTTSNLTYSPTVANTGYQFYLTVTDIHGCVGISPSLSSVVNALQNIQGNAFQSSNPVPGDVIIYKYETFLGKFDSVTIQPVNGIGQFLFPSVPEGDYIIQAIPTATNLQTSYTGTNAISWKSAVPFNHTCLSQPVINIDVIPFTNIGTGPGEISGKLLEGDGFVQRYNEDVFKPLAPGGPIGGIVVKGGRNPGGQMFSQTITPDATAGPLHGTYTFSNLPYGDYFILVDIPGLDTNGTYHITLSAGTPSVTNMNFFIDSIYINPVGNITTIQSQENSLFEHKIKLFPNPAKETTIIEYELIEPANVQIELFDILGKKSKTIVTESKQDKNKYKHSINLNDLSSGIYFIKTKFNNSENIIKLIITN